MIKSRARIYTGGRPLIEILISFPWVISPHIKINQATNNHGHRMLANIVFVFVTINQIRRMIGCQNCAIRLHLECLVDDVLTKTYNRLAKGQIEDQVNNSTANVKATKHRVKNDRKQKRHSARAYDGKFEAVIEDKEKAPRIEITDLRLVEGQRATWQEDIYFPKYSAKAQKVVPIVLHLRCLHIQ